MAVNKKLGMLLLGILLIALGVLSIVSMRVSGLDLILNIFAIITGIVIIIALGRVSGALEIGMLLLGIWLVIWGLFPLIGVSFSGLGVLLAILAIAAGVLILIGLNWKKLAKNIGKLLLAIWLLIAGLTAIGTIAISGVVSAVLAILAGIFILIER